jgi:hypothetical protein
MRRLARSLLLAFVLGGLVVACGGDDDAKLRLAPHTEGLPGEERLAELGLVVGPPANLIAACKRLARQTRLTVYCPPVVPEGPVDAPKERRENAYIFGDANGYGLSLQSDSLIDPGSNHDPLAAKHWVVAATAFAKDAARSVDQSVRLPRAGLETLPKRFTVRGVDATLVTGDVAGSGVAGSGHAIVYWRIGDTFNQASVHFDDRAQVAAAIARGLMIQMVECGPVEANSDSELCAWVFA